jgi:hypothetical protein
MGAAAAAGLALAAAPEMAGPAATVASCSLAGD